MTKTKTAIYLDTAFICLLLFFVQFAWLDRIIKNAFLCCFVCIFIVFIEFFVILKLNLKKHKLLNLKNLDLKISEKCLHFLKFSTISNYNQYFEKLFSSKSIKTFFFENEKFYFYINLKTKLKASDYFEINEFKLTKSQKELLVICEQTDEEFHFLNSESQTKLKLFNFVELFKIIKEKQFYPTNISELKKINTSSYKLTKSKILSSLTRSHFKSFIFSGMSLILFSFFIPYSVYYLFFGTALICFAIICLFRKEAPQENKTSLFDAIKK